jgi:hypothetical protein
MFRWGNLKRRADNSQYALFGICLVEKALRHLHIIFLLLARLTLTVVEPFFLAGQSTSVQEFLEAHGFGRDAKCAPADNTNCINNQESRVV